MTRFLFLALATFLAGGAGVALTACGGNGSLKAPRSDQNFDDPCDPGGGGGGGSTPPADGGAVAVPLPGGAPGIAFDDLRFSGDISKVLVPGGRSGNLDMIDPSTGVLSMVGGFSSSTTFSGDLTQGPGSADEGNGFVYVVDRTSSKLAVVDPKALAIVQSIALAGPPDLVRYVSSTKEVWVTEPMKSQIEVFSVPTDPTKAPPMHAANIPVPGGPEGLAIDADGGHAFTSSTASTTFEIGITMRNIEAQWPNACGATRDVVSDASRAYVVLSCDEGKIAIMSTDSGTTLGSQTTPMGIDQVAYDARKGRVYAQSPADGTMTVVDVSSVGGTTLRGAIATVVGGRGAVSVGAGTVYVGDTAKGQLLMVRDPF